MKSPYLEDPLINKHYDLNTEGVKTTKKRKRTRHLVIFFLIAALTAFLMLSSLSYEESNLPTPGNQLVLVTLNDTIQNFFVNSVFGTLSYSVGDLLDQFTSGDKPFAPTFVKVTKMLSALAPAASFFLNLFWTTPDITNTQVVTQITDALNNSTKLIIDKMENGFSIVTSNIDFTREDIKTTILSAFATYAIDNLDLQLSFLRNLNAEVYQRDPVIIDVNYFYKFCGFAMSDCNKAFLYVSNDLDSVLKAISAA